MDIEKALIDHDLWVESYGRIGVRADLRYADLSRLDLSKSNLKYAILVETDLRFTDLSETNLKYVNLSRADLTGAKLTRAKLNGSDLSRANLRCADLSYTNLIRATLIGANLWRCQVDGKYIKTLNEIDSYLINYTHDRLQIGCENYSFKEWLSFSDEVVGEMDKGLLQFWKDNKVSIFDSINENKALHFSEE